MSRSHRSKKQNIGSGLFRVLLPAGAFPPVVGGQPVLSCGVRSQAVVVIQVIIDQGKPLQSELQLTIPGETLCSLDQAVSSNSYSVTTSNSGYKFGGYTIWVSELDLSDNPSISNNWLGSHRSDGINWFPLGGITVTGAEGHRTLAAGWSWVAFSAPSSGLEPGDLFKVIEGYPPPSLARNTWAGINNLF